MSTASRRWAPSLTLGAAGFCASMSWQVVVPILSLHLAHIGFGIAEIGVVVGTFSLSMGLVELQAGVIAAAIGRRRQLLGALVANALCLGAAAAGEARALVAVALTAVGAARGVLIPPLHATVADSATPEDHGRAFGTFWLCTSFAALAGPALGGFAASRIGERAPFVAAALFSLAAIPLLAGRPMPGRARPFATSSCICQPHRSPASASPSCSATAWPASGPRSCPCTRPGRAPPFCSSVGSSRSRAACTP